MELGARLSPLQLWNINKQKVKRGTRHQIKTKLGLIARNIRTNANDSLGRDSLAKWMMIFKRTKHGCIFIHIIVKADGGRDLKTNNDNKKLNSFDCTRILKIRDICNRQIFTFLVVVKKSKQTTNLWQIFSHNGWRRRKMRSAWIDRECVSVVLVRFFRALHAHSHSVIFLSSSFELRMWRREDRNKQLEPGGFSLR